MEDVTEKYKIEAGQQDSPEAKPVIVLTGTTQEFEDFCRKTNRNTKSAIAVRQGYQLEFYPDYEIVLYGSYDLNAAFNSQEYTARTRESDAAKVKRILGS